MIPTPPDPFTAIARCPRCGRVEVHKMRSPKPAPRPEVIAEWERTHTTNEIREWGNPNPVRIRYDPPRPVDESVFEVIRMCRCGHEWGMA
ncbi:hypothetical protein ACTD5D_39670 [Nocardia takedensis]|uniref:hypothetical protein n=1 Tax=Nocardia takedensis TaxID=259390 RepID=UPI003F775F29